MIALIPGATEAVLYENLRDGGAQRIAIGENTVATPTPIAGRVLHVAHDPVTNQVTGIVVDANGCRRLSIGPPGASLEVPLNTGVVAPAMQRAGGTGFQTQVIQSNAWHHLTYGELGVFEMERVHAPQCVADIKDVQALPGGDGGTGGRIIVAYAAAGMLCGGRDAPPPGDGLLEITDTEVNVLSGVPFDRVGRFPQGFVAARNTSGSSVRVTNFGPSPGTWAFSADAVRVGDVMNAGVALVVSASNGIQVEDEQGMPIGPPLPIPDTAAHAVVISTAGLWLADLGPAMLNGPMHFTIVNGTNNRPLGIAVWVGLDGGMQVRRVSMTDGGLL